MLDPTSCQDMCHAQHLDLCATITMSRQTFIHTFYGGKEGQKVAHMTRAVTVVLLCWQWRECREGARQIAAQAVGILAIIWSLPQMSKE